MSLIVDSTPTASRTRLEKGGIYIPSAMLLLVTLWFAWDGATYLRHYGLLRKSLLSAQNELTGPIVIGFVAIVMCCEHFAPAVRRPLLSRGHVQDFFFMLLFVIGVVPLVTLLGTAFSSLMATHVPWMMLRSFGPIPQWLVVVAALVLMDGCNWLTHFAHHRITALWRVHAIHHSQEELSILTTFRAHPIVHTTSSFAATVPIVILTGYHPITPVLITLYLVIGAFPHANVAWTFGPLGRVFASPAYHRVHHDVDGPYDMNLGIALTIWDALARRAIVPSPAGQQCKTGLFGRPIEVEQTVAHYRPLRLLAQQLVEPFGRSSS